MHLIMEYAIDDVLFGGKATRANRFIVSSDRSNGALAGLEVFHDTVLKASAAAAPSRASLVVVSGLHMVDKVRAGDLYSLYALMQRHRVCMLCRVVSLSPVLLLVSS